MIERKKIYKHIKKYFVLAFSFILVLILNNNCAFANGENSIIKDKSLLTVKVGRPGTYRGFVEDKSGIKYYTGSEKSYYTGIKAIGKSTYYFNKEGYLSSGWVNDGKNWLYFKDGSGELAISEWLRVRVSYGNTSNMRWKYFNRFGHSIDKLYSENGKSYLSLSGPYTGYRVGWYKFGKTWGYFKPNGVMLESEWAEVEVNIGGSSKTRKKYFNRFGFSQDRLFETNGKTYLSIAGPNTGYRVGWYKFGRTWGYFKNDATMARNEWISLNVNFGSGNKLRKKYFDKNGYSIARIFIENDKTYLSNAGPNTGYRFGWLKLYDNWIYFGNSDGSMVVSEWKFAKTDYGNRPYRWKYFNRYGHSIDKLYWENSKAYLSLSGPYGGYRIGWYKFGRTWGYFKSDATMSRNEWVLADCTDFNGVERKAWRYFDSKGFSIAGTYREEGKSWNCGIGPREKVYKGWVKNGTATFYYDESGVAATGWTHIDGKLFHFNDNGVLSTGTQYIEDTRYDFDENGNYIDYLEERFGYTRFRENGTWKYKKKNGDRLRYMGLKTFGEYRYYFNADNSLGSGWYYINDKLVIFVNEDGRVNEGITANVQYGADLSQWNGVVVNGKYRNTNIDFKAMKDSGIDYVILRSGYGKYAFQKDPLFEDNYREAKKVGLKVGVYHYAYANSMEAARQELKVFMDTIRGKTFEYPVYYDMEEEGYNKMGSLSNKTLTDMAIMVTDGIRNEGYIPGIYANQHWLTNKIMVSRLKDDVDLWIASWTRSLKYDLRDIGMWQYTDQGKIDGNIGRIFDLNVSFKNR